MKIGNNRYMLSALFLAGFFSCGQVCAGVSVYPIEVSINSGGNSKIEVMSQAKDVSFVRITAKKIVNPGTPEEKEIPVNITGDDSLIVTPQKLAITPGGVRIVRLVTLTPPEKETTWRVYFEEASENNFREDKKSEGNKKSRRGRQYNMGCAGSCCAPKPRRKPENRQ